MATCANDVAFSDFRPKPLIIANDLTDVKQFDFSRSVVKIHALFRKFVPAIGARNSLEPKIDLSNLSARHHVLHRVRKP